MKVMRYLRIGRPSGLGLGLAVFAVVIAVLLLGSCGGDDAVEPATPTSEEATPTMKAEPAATILLDGEGLGIVAFDQPADEVRAELERIIGSPPSDPWMQADWIEFVGWDDLGLYVGFDSPTSADFTGVSRFLGWDQVAAAGGAGFATAEGIGVGSTLAELQATYGDRLDVASEPDECAGEWFVRMTPSTSDTVILGVLDQAPADDARLTMLHAGIGVGC